MANKPVANVELESGTSIRITFPAGTKGNLRRQVPLDELLKVLRLPEADVEGQSASNIDMDFLPGAPD